MNENEDPMFAPTIGRIRICNTNSFPITDRCDNIVYKFDPNVEVDIPLDAACHLFGFHATATEEDLFRHCSKRFGWNTPMHQEKELDWEYFNNLEIRPVSYRLVEVKEDGPQPKRPRGRPRKEPITTDVIPEPSE